MPWYGLHIYWDGSFGICCSEDHKAYTTASSEYNISCMSIRDWFNSEPIRKFRMSILQDQKLSACRGCYLEEQHSGHSRRFTENQKSVIFTQAFNDSFAQSPGHKYFEHSAITDGFTNTMPVDLHINLGNFCNLGCKMCNAEASSTIASQEVKWGLVKSKPYLGTDWTRDTAVWNSFKQQLLDIEGLKNIHFMGGETLLTDRLEDLVDTMIEHKRFDLCFSFVTNGTVFKPAVLDKLKLFKRVGIEISIETLTEHNAYQRQGTNTAEVLANIKQYQTWCNNSSITITLRSAPSLLTIGYYHTLLEFALEQKFLIRSNLCYTPEFLYAIHLPVAVKKQYIKKYTELISKLDTMSVDTDFNTSDPHNYVMVVKKEAIMCIDLLSQCASVDSDKQLRLMVEHCCKWDRVYQLDARTLYPELAEVWDRYAY